MQVRFIRWIVGSAVLGAFAFVPIDAGAQDPLGNTTWIESVHRVLDTTGTAEFGNDNLVPEPLSATQSAAGYLLTEAVSFDSPGPPNATAAVHVDYESGLTALQADAYVAVGFQFRVRELGTPPVPVDTVPVAVHALGTVEAAGDSALLVGSMVSFSLFAPSGSLLDLTINADDAPSVTYPASDSFDHSEEFDLAPGVIVFTDMIADAGAVAQPPQGGTSASTTAHVDPVIEVADALIPGTSSSYRDYFDIEFSPGYFALGQTPVERTTWGRVKRLYGN